MKLYIFLLSPFSNIPYTNRDIKNYRHPSAYGLTLTLLLPLPLTLPIPLLYFRLYLNIAICSSRSKSGIISCLQLRLFRYS